jgi:hypothetical protein
MLRDKISREIRFCIDDVRSAFGDAGCILLGQMSICPKRGRQMVIHIAFLEETHDGSSRTVAYLKDGRLERSLDCRRREGGGRAAPDLSIRLLEPVCRRSFIHDVVTKACRWDSTALS